MHSPAAFARDDRFVARKNGWAVLISAATRGGFKVRPGRGCGRAFSGYFRRTSARRRGEVMSDIVTAGILVIGDEILSGRTKDKNIGYIAEYLTNIGIDLKEVRVVADEERDIIAALNTLRARYTYVFTNGGIGPTHDDITAECVAKPFGVAIRHDPRAVEIMTTRVTQTGGVM